jgi:hypothetical protein
MSRKLSEQVLQEIACIQRRFGPADTNSQPLQDLLQHNSLKKSLVRNFKLFVDLLRSVLVGLAPEVVSYGQVPAEVVQASGTEVTIPAEVNHRLPGTSDHHGSECGVVQVITPDH